MSVPEYTQEMRINHEPCPYCGLWHSAVSCPPLFTHSKQRIMELENKLTRLTSLLARMGEVGDEFVRRSVRAFCCDAQASHYFVDSDDVHDDDCPVTKWAELKKEMEG